MLTKVPFFVGFSVRLTLTVLPFAIVPMLQTTSCECGFGAQLPCVELTEPNPVFLGMVSVAVTPFAVDGPLFLTVIV
jgi:hypothetical protein